MVNYSLRAKDIMQVEVATILDDASLVDAAHLMRLEGVRSLVVEPHDEHDPPGIITFSDIVTQALAEGRDPAKISVSEVMTKPVITVPPEMGVKHIAKLFQITGISHLPVMDGYKVAGIISMTDLVTEMIAEPDS